MLVVDASVLVIALADDTDLGDRGRQRLIGEALAAPEIVDLEVASVLRRLVSVGLLPPRRANLAVKDLADLPLDRARHLRLLPRVWGLRENATTYDASYVALAEALECTLLTADERLARSPGTNCRFETFA